MKIQLLDERCMPYKKHKSDAGYDLRATETKILGYLEEHVFDTGVRVEIPSGFCGLVIPRSSFGSRGLVLKNTVGVIDSDYRGNILVKLRNNSQTPVTITKYDRFVQLVIVPVYLGALEVVDSISNTGRGVGGFGSTGND